MKQYRVLFEIKDESGKLLHYGATVDADNEYVALEMVKVQILSTMRAEDNSNFDWRNRDE